MNPSRSADAAAVMRLLQFADSAFPVGAFSFSAGLETAAAEGIVRDAATLEAFTRDIVRQAAFCDGIAALRAHRDCRAEDPEGVRRMDGFLLRCKLNAEARLMTCRMGRKLAELSDRLLPQSAAGRWLGDIRAERTPGTYPVSQAVLFAAAGLDERALFCASQYGAAGMVLNAALRCVRVSHYDTQCILLRIGAGADALFDEISELEAEDMHIFAPQSDILASLHEKGSSRMFMN